MTELVKKKQAAKLVKKSVSQYKRTYKKLEKYDKGLIKTAKDILGIRHMQEAIRKFS